MKWFWNCLGMVFFVVGVIGIVLPVLPTIPFFLLSLMCFRKGSDTLHHFFLRTRLYRYYLKNHAEGMTILRKIVIYLGVTFLMIFSYLVFLKEQNTIIYLVITNLAYAAYLIFLIPLRKK